MLDITKIILSAAIVLAGCPWCCCWEDARGVEGEAVATCPHCAPPASREAPAPKPCPCKSQRGDTTLAQTNIPTGKLHLGAGQINFQHFPVAAIAAAPSASASDAVHFVRQMAPPHCSIPISLGHLLF